MISQEKLSYDILCRTKTRQELDAINFNPNQLVGSSSFPNPMINALIACEDYNTAIKIIKMYSDILDPNQKDGEQKSALIIAAKMFNAEEIVVILLETFKDKIGINTQDENGWSALHYASAFRNLYLAQKLLEHGADSSLLNKDNNTPLQCFKMPEQQIAEILLSMDIDPFRDVKAKGNKLSWHFRFLFMDQKYSVDNFYTLLSLTTTWENMNQLRSYVESDTFTAPNKSNWIAAFRLPENQLQHKTVIESIVSKSFPLEALWSKVKSKENTTHPKCFLNHFTNFVSKHPYIAIAGLTAISGLAATYLKRRPKV